MATVSPIPNQQDRSTDAEENDLLPAEHRLPGCTVDTLLAEGKVEEARAELERLVQAGNDSGPSVEATPAFWERLYARARSERKSDQ